MSAWHTPRDASGRVQRFGKGANRVRRQKKRAEAVARQQRNIDRGYYIDQWGVQVTPAPSEDL